MSIPTEPEAILAGARLTLTTDGAVWWAAEATLIVSDLHLEKGSSLARRGMMVPPHDTMLTLARLARLVERLRPARIVALGDSFHDAFGPERMDLPARTALARLMTGRDWIWITGNHDPVIDRALGGDQMGEWGAGGLAFRHIPTRGAAGELAGHLHPAAAVQLGAISLRRPCFAFDGTRMILPAFGAYAGGLNLRNDAFDGLFAPKSLVVGLLSEDRVHLFPGRLAR